MSLREKILIGVIAILLVLAGIESYYLLSPTQEQPTPVTSRTLIVRGIYGSIPTLDPVKTSSGTAWRTYIPSIYNGLVKVTNKLGVAGPAGELVADLARSWDVSEDGKVWTFYLRKNVMFHKGYGECTADDVAYSVQRLQDSTSGSILVSTYEKISKTEVLDNYTIRFTLSEPEYGFEKNSGYLFALDRGGLAVVSKKAVEEVGSKDYSMNPIGTGPFVFQSYTPNSEAVLVANEEYFMGPPPVDELKFKLIEDEATANLALMNKEVDFQPWINIGDDINTIQTDYPDIIIDRRALGEDVNGISINVNIPPFDDVRVRQALLYALDMPTIIESLYGTMYELATSPWPGAFAVDASVLDINEAYPYNITKAQELLAEAGYPNGFDTTIVTISSYPLRLALDALVSYWDEVGIHATIDVVDVATWVQYRAQRQTPLITNAIAFAKPYLLLYSEGTDCASNYTGCDALFELAWAEPNDNFRAEIYEEIQQKVVEDVPYIPFAQGSIAVAYWNYVHNYYVTMESDFSHIYVNKTG